MGDHAGRHVIVPRTLPKPTGRTQHTEARVKREDGRALSLLPIGPPNSLAYAALVRLLLNKRFAGAGVSAFACAHPMHALLLSSKTEAES